MGRLTKEEQALRAAQDLLDDEMKRQEESAARINAIRQAAQLVEEHKRKMEAQAAADAEVRAWADKVDAVGWTEQDAAALEHLANALPKRVRLFELKSSGLGMARNVAENVTQDALDLLRAKAEDAPSSACKCGAADVYRAILEEMEA